MAASHFDPADLGRPPSAARALAEQTAERVQRELRQQFDRLLPPGTELGRIRPPNGHQALAHLARFSNQLDGLTARYGRLAPQGAGAESVLVMLWEAWNGCEAGRALEDIHGQIRQLDDNLAATVVHVRERLEKPDAAGGAESRTIPPERLADYKLLLDIVTELFALRRAALIAELNDIESAFGDTWLARGAEGWDALQRRWQEWDDD